MTVAAYIELVKALLLTDPIIAHFHIIRERQTFIDGHLRVRMTLVDVSLLEFSEYVQHLPNRGTFVITYSYHWADSQGNLIRRWDNTPHFPNLSGFPHHIHDGITNTVSSGAPIDIFAVIGEITQQFNNSSSTQT